VRLPVRLTLSAERREDLPSRRDQESNHHDRDDQCEHHEPGR